MNFLIADTFADNLARLTGDEQKAVNTTAFDLQMHSGTGRRRHHDRYNRRRWPIRSPIRMPSGASAS